MIPVIPKIPNPGKATASTNNNIIPNNIIKISVEDANCVKYPAPNARVKHIIPIVPPIPHPALYNSEITPIVPKVVNKDDTVGFVNILTTFSDQFSSTVIISYSFISKDERSSSMVSPLPSAIPYFNANSAGSPYSQC